MNKPNIVINDLKNTSLFTNEIQQLQSINLDELSLIRGGGTWMGLPTTSSGGAKTKRMK